MFRACGRVCSVGARIAPRMEASTAVFGILPDGRRVDAITLANPSGMQVTMINFGATITSVKVPSKSSPVAEEVTLCYPTLEALAAKSPYYGSTVGRVANRIARGKFSVDDKVYGLAVNNGANHLHGGLRGFDKAVWDYCVRVTEGATSITFTYSSHDGEEGYPGNVLVAAEYSLSRFNELSMVFTATTDKSTPINVCNHTYWNLSGALSRKITQQVLDVQCPYYLPVDATQIPTGEVAEVMGSAFDLTTPTVLGDRLGGVDGGGEPGFDHCFSRLPHGDTRSSLELRPIATLQDPVSGRKMVVSTTQPAVQLYCGNFLSKSAEDHPHTQHNALCLETQNYPDAINHPHFPSSLLAPGTEFKHTTVHQFSW